MKPNVFLKLYVGDWLKDTLHLDATSTGAYFLLILAHRGKPGLPNDDQTLRTIARVRELDWCRVKAQISEFFQDKGGLWINNRSVEDWERDCRDYEAACARTKAATNARTNVTKDVTSNVTATQSESESESDPKPASKSESKPLPGCGVLFPSMEIPENLNTPAFLDAWSDWKEYRKSIKRSGKRAIEFTFQAQLKDLAKRGPDEAVEMITQSILRGWTGLFEVQNHSANGSKYGNGLLSNQQIAVFNGELLRIINEMRVIKSQYMDHQSWESKDINRFKELKTRKYELRSMLGVKA